MSAEVGERGVGARVTRPDGAGHAPPAPARAPRSRARLLGAAVRTEAVQVALSARARALAAVCALGPAAFVVAATHQATLPSDTLFGRWLLTSGLAAPLVVLGFVSTWALPLLVSLVAGDVFSREDAAGTWPTLLTRSASRAQVFTAKVLVAGAVTVGVVVLLALSGTIAGAATVGTQPLTSLSGTLLAADQALPRVLGAWAAVLAPALAFSALAIVLSVLSRSSLVGVGGPVVLGLVMQGVQLLGGVDPLRHLLLSDALTTWHGLLTEPVLPALLVRGTAVSAGWALVCVVVAAEVFSRRDVSS